MTNTKKAHLTWEGHDLDFRATLGSGYQMDFSGQSGEAAASPMETLAAALAGCSAMDVISILQKKRQKVTGFEIEVSGERAAEHPKRYTAMNLVYVIRGEEIDPKAVERSIQLSEEKYCSVMATFHQANIPVNTTYRIEETVPVAP